MYCVTAAHDTNASGLVIMGYKILQIILLSNSLDISTGPMDLLVIYG